MVRCFGQPTIRCTAATTMKSGECRCTTTCGCSKKLCLEGFQSGAQLADDFAQEGRVSPRLCGFAIDQVAALGPAM